MQHSSKSSGSSRGGGSSKVNSRKASTSSKPAPARPKDRPRPRPQQHAQVHSILVDAGCKPITMQVPTRAPINPVLEYDYASVEVMAMCLNSLRGPDQLPRFHTLLWSGVANKLQLSAALLASAPAQQLEVLESWAHQVLTKHRKLSSATAQQEDTGVTAHEQLAVQLHEWVRLVRRKPIWPQMQPILQRVVEASPVAPEQVHRDGFEGEAWTCEKLRAALPAGWQLEASSVLDMSEHPGATSDPAGVRPDSRGTVKGVKGELDAVLIDPAGVVQGVVEVKLGGDIPFRTIYSDVKKLTRVMEWVRGRRIPLLDPSSSSSSSSAAEPRALKFSPTAMPAYVALKPGDLMDSEAVLREAEAALLKISISRALGGASAWRGVQLLNVNSERTTLHVTQGLVSSMRRQVDKSFMSTVAAASIYQMTDYPQ